MESEFGADIVHFENHVSDDLAIPEGEARANWYGVSGIPHVRINGQWSIIGAGSCGGAANNYRPRIQGELDENAGISPIAIVGSFLPSGTDIQVQAIFELEDPATLTNLRATIVVYEDDVYYCCGYGGVDTWERTSRGIYDQNVSLVNVGDQVILSHTFVHNGDWNPDNMQAVAYVQTTTGTREIYQGAQLPKVLDFTFDLTHLVWSVPSGNGQAIFPAVLTNIGDAADTFTLEPGAPFGDWVTEFQVCGDPTWYTTAQAIVLNSAETCDVNVRVTTDGVTEVRSGGFNVSSTASARTSFNDIRVFNGSYSVFVSDDDSANSDEASILASLDNLGYLYEHWDIFQGQDNRSPGFSNLSGFDYVIWQTGLRFSELLSDSDMDALMQYIDNGGALFLTSQEFLDTQGGANSFITDYLGIASWTTDVSYGMIEGITSDPIGDGINVDLDFNIPSFNQGDDAVPGPTAETSFEGPDGSHAMIRNTMVSGAKTVFMPAAFNAIVDDVDPNNAQTILERILDWLQPETPANVIDGTAAVLGSQILGARPNPFNPRTEIAISLSNRGAIGTVSLEIYDLKGRRVAGVFEGELTAGNHIYTWDGLTDDGIAVESGVYFSRLTTIEGEASEKLVLLK